MSDLSSSFRRRFPARLWLEYPQRVPAWFHALEAFLFVGAPATVLAALFLRARLRYGSGAATAAAAAARAPMAPALDINAKAAQSPGAVASRRHVSAALGADEVAAAATKAGAAFTASYAAAAAASAPIGAAPLHASASGLK